MIKEARFMGVDPAISTMASKPPDIQAEIKEKHAEIERAMNLLAATMDKMVHEYYIKNKVNIPRSPLPRVQIRWWGISINEGRLPCLSIQWNPWRERYFYFRWR